MSSLIMFLIYNHHKFGHLGMDQNYFPPLEWFYIYIYLFMYVCLSVCLCVPVCMQYIYRIVYSTESMGAPTINMYRATASNVWGDQCS